MDTSRTRDATVTQQRPEEVLTVRLLFHHTFNAPATAEEELAASLWARIRGQRILIKTKYPECELCPARPPHTNAHFI